MTRFETDEWPHPDEVHAGLRRWGRGLYPAEAGVELLIRALSGRFAQPWMGWVQRDDYEGFYIDAEELNRIGVRGPFSGGERRVLAIVLSLLSDDYPVSLADAASGLDQHLGRLVLAAISHAMGSHQWGRTPIWEQVDSDGRGRMEVVGWNLAPGALYPWPESE